MSSSSESSESSESSGERGGRSVGGGGMSGIDSVRRQLMHSAPTNVPGRVRSGNKEQQVHQLWRNRLFGMLSPKKTERAPKSRVWLAQVIVSQ